METYLFRYRRRGHAFKKALGHVGILPLDDARRAVEIYVGEIARDVDPIAKRKAEAELKRAQIAAKRVAKIEAAQEEAFTVGALIKAWAAARGKDGKDEKRSVHYVAAIKAALLTTFEPVLNLPAGELSKERIEKLIEAAERARGLAAAARAQMAIGMAFKRAIKSGKLKVNPCTALEPRQLRARERTLTAFEIQRVWRAAGTLSPPYAAFVRFLMATAVRRNEALHARWSEIEGDLWHLPSSRMKAKRPFTVPLTSAALGSLPARGNQGDFIFTMSNGVHPLGGPTRIKIALDKASEADGAGPLAPWTFHDLRRSFATLLGDRGVDYVICDLCLAHGIPLSRTGKTYQRSYKITERKAALDLWGAMLDPEPEPIQKGRKPSLRIVA
jgi:integrase